MPNFGLAIMNSSSDLIAFGRMTVSGFSSRMKSGLSPAASGGAMAALLPYAESAVARQRLDGDPTAPLISVHRIRQLRNRIIGRLIVSHHHAHASVMVASSGSNERRQSIVRSAER